MIVTRDGGDETRWYSLSEAARLVRKNHWDVQVDGIHSESLRRAWRDSGKRHGKRIGRDVFFSADAMMRLGYAIAEPDAKWLELGDVVELIPETEEQHDD
jgi:hypothetical protein